MNKITIDDLRDMKESAKQVGELIEAQEFVGDSWIIELCEYVEVLAGACERLMFSLQTKNYAWRGGCDE